MPDNNNPDRLNQPDAVEALAFPVVGIGASAGGLRALETFFRHLPAESGMAFVIVQHLAPDYKSELAMLLQRHTAMQVTQVTDGMTVQPNAVYVIPPAKDLTIAKGQLQLTQRQRPAQRGPIDIFFNALAVDQLDRAVAIVLSGTGTDGSVGVKAIKENGGITLAQAPADAEYDGMPLSAIGTNSIDLVGSAEELALRLVGYREKVTKIQLPALEAKLSPEGTDVLNRILQRLHEKVGHDFAHYKDSTILRRIGRRMRINDIDNMVEYLDYLQRHEAEAEALFHDFLISVTNFFRDPAAFTALEERVMPKLFAGKTQTDQLRVWAPGCATGEEAYSLAILLSEQASMQTSAPDIQIFATDIDRTALEIAQRGFYTDAIATEVAVKRLQGYFTKVTGGYQVKKDLREKILFANHSLISDPPFSKLDLISCRNLLIYLNRDLQEKVLGLFHYALRPGGYLFLGISESTDVAANLFQAVDKKQRLFQRQESSLVQPHLLNRPLHPRRRRAVAGETQQAETSRSEVVDHYQQWRLQRYTPPALLVDRNYNLIHLFGDVGRYLQIKEGPPLSIFSMVFCHRCGCCCARHSMKRSKMNCPRHHPSSRWRSKEKVRWYVCGWDG
ncbi:MAG: chemotaxis protein CheB [Caldilineaceae bacterium]